MTEVERAWPDAKDMIDRPGRKPRTQTYDDTPKP
jgi:hypothetical protein